MSQNKINSFGVVLNPGWLKRQMDQVNADIVEWPTWMRREAGFMTHVERMDRPVTVTLREADWWIVQGLLTGERNKVRDEGTRPEYLKTLERMRTEVIRRTE